MPSAFFFFFRPVPAGFALALCFSLVSSLAFGAGGGAPPNLLAFPAAMGAANASGMPRSPGAGDNTTLVQFNAQAALALPIGGEAAITLPRLGTLTLVHDRQELHPNGDVTWVGYFKGWGDNYRVVITSGPNGTAGRIVSPDGEFSLLPGGSGGVWLRDNSQAGLNPVIQDSDDTVAVPTAPASSVPAGLAAMAPATASSPPTAAAAAPAADPNVQATIDLMIVYTAGMVQYYGDGLQTRLNNLVAIANQAYIDSGIHITLRLVHSVEVDYVQSGTLNTVLNDLTAGNGLFSNVSALRKQYGADLVTLIIKPTSIFCGGEGLAWSSSPISVDYGYSVFLDLWTVNGCNNNDLVMAHELGHNMGANHDRAALSNPGSDYSYGYGITGLFADIMSAGYISAPNVAKFSNPNITCDANNDPCGIAAGQPGAADSAQTLNDNRLAVAALMPAVGVAPPTATLTATPSTVAYGGTTALAWSSTNATSCSAVSSDGQAYSAVPTAGNATVAPPATVTYTLTCSGPGGTSSAAATVTVSLDAVACLFNWGEKNYPALFAPAGASMQAWSVYTYRHYAGTNAYLGVSSADDHVYYLGPDGHMQDEGALSHWLPVAGCQ